MTKDIERISVKKFESALNEENIITETLHGSNNVVMHIKRVLSLTEMVEFVKGVVESCVDAENGEYIPEAYDFAIRVAVLTHYANFTMPSNMEKRYWLVYNTSAFQQILSHIDERQFNDIVRTIDKKIKFMIDVISSTAVSKINEVISKFEDIALASETVFGVLNSDELSNAIKGISKLNNASEEDLAKSILQSRMKEESEPHPEESNG